MSKHPPSLRTLVISHRFSAGISRWWRRRRIPSWHTTPAPATTHCRLLIPSLPGSLLFHLRSSPALPTTGRWTRRHLLHLAASETAADAADDCEEEQEAYAAGYAYHDGFVIVDPGLHFTTKGRALTLSLDNISASWQQLP